MIVVSGFCLVAWPFDQEPWKKSFGSALLFFAAMSIISFSEQVSHDSFNSIVAWGAGLLLALYGVMFSQVDI